MLVDGEKAQTRELFDTFLAVDLPAGTHKISLSYEPQGLRTGAILSAVSLAALAAITVGQYAFNKRKKH